MRKASPLSITTAPRCGGDGAEVAFLLVAAGEEGDVEVVEGVFVDDLDVVAIAVHGDVALAGGEDPEARRREVRAA